jgi:hypothetical protein
LPPTHSSSILVMVGSAGINPWLEIEQSGQEILLCENAERVQDHIWFSANPNFVSSAKHRILIGIAKFQMWHYPGKGKYFVVLRELLVDLLKCFPIQVAMRMVFLNSGKKSFETRVGNRVELDLPTSTHIAGSRTIRAFEWALHNSDFDYLVRITSTCLINEPALMRFIEAIPKNRVYAGQEMTSFGSNPFMSGAALVLSRDVVANIVAHQHKYRFDMYEDVALGRLINDFYIADWIPMNRLDLTTVESAECVDLDELASAPIIRCKAEDVTRSAEPVLKIFDVVANRLGWTKRVV